MEKLSWHTVEHHHTEKNTDWYWIVGIVSISIAIIAIIMNNIIFAILIIVSAFTLSLFASVKPKIMEVTLDRSGITMGQTRYPYANIQSFWVETREHTPKLILKSKKVFMPFITAFIEDVDPDEVRHHLLQHLQEEEHVEPFLEKLMIYLGF